MQKYRLEWQGDGSLDLSQVLDEHGIPVIFPRRGATAIVDARTFAHPHIQNYLGAGLKGTPLGHTSPSPIPPTPPSLPLAPAPAPAPEKPPAPPVVSEPPPEPKTVPVPLTDTMPLKETEVAVAAAPEVEVPEVEVPEADSPGSEPSTDTRRRRGRGR